MVRIQTQLAENGKPKKNWSVQKSIAKPRHENVQSHICQHYADFDLAKKIQLDKGFSHMRRLKKKQNTNKPPCTEIMIQCDNNRSTVSIFYS